MKPPVHPHERRSRIYWIIQLVVASLGAVAIPVMLLQEPTRDHVIMAIVMPIICIIGAILAIRVLKKLPEEYRLPSDTGAGASGDPDIRP